LCSSRVEIADAAARCKISELTKNGDTTKDATMSAEVRVHPFHILLDLGSQPLSTDSIDGRRLEEILF